MYFRHIGWDSDDLFHNCHHNGQFAYADEAGLLYCAESDLDRALLVSDEVYARFVDVLDDMMRERLPEEAVFALLDQTRAELFAQLQDDAVCGAMVELIDKEPAGATCEGARAYIDSEMQHFREMLHTRAQELQGKIDAWRMQP